MALEGPLKDLHIQDVFQLLDLGRKSGVLRVTSELRQTAGTVCFDRGGVVAAAVGSDPQPLGARLVRSGKLTGADLDRARSMQTSGDDRRLGDILVALVSSPVASSTAAQAQIEEAVFELLRWSEGYFRFEEGASCHAAVEAPVRFPTEALLMEAARRIDEWSRIESQGPHLRLVPRLPAPEPRAANARSRSLRVGSARGGRRGPRSALAGRDAGPLGVRSGANGIRAHQRRHRGTR